MRSILTSIRGKIVEGRIKMLGDVVIGDDTLKSKLPRGEGSLYLR